MVYKVIRLLWLTSPPDWTILNATLFLSPSKYSNRKILKEVTLHNPSSFTTTISLAQLKITLFYHTQLGEQRSRNQLKTFMSLKSMIWYFFQLSLNHPRLTFEFKDVSGLTGAFELLQWFFFHFWNISFHLKSKTKPQIKRVDIIHWKITLAFHHIFRDRCEPW